MNVYLNERIKKISSITVLAFTLLAFTAGISDGAQEMIPFECDGTIYYSIDPNTSSTRLTTYNDITQRFENVGQPSLRYNGISYNPVDDYIYATVNSSGELLRIDSQGKVVSLGFPRGPSFSGAGWVSSTFTEDGLMIVAQGLNQGGALLVIEGVEVNEPRVISFAQLNVNIVDVVYNPADDLVYTFDSANLRTVTVDPYTGVLTPVGDFQHTDADRPGVSGLAFDDEGNLMSIGGASNSEGGTYVIFQADLDPESSEYGKFSIYEVTKEPLGSGADATSCYF